MTGKLLVFLAVLLLVPCLSFAGQPHLSIVVSVSDVNTNTPVGEAAGVLYKVHSLLLINDGPDPVYFNFTDGVAVATGASLGSGESISLTSGGGPYDVTNVGLICNPGDTATVRIFAFPSE